MPGFLRVVFLLGSVAGAVALRGQGSSTGGDSVPDYVLKGPFPTNGIPEARATHDTLVAFYPPVLPPLERALRQPFATGDDELFDAESTLRVSEPNLSDRQRQQLAKVKQRTERQAARRHPAPAELADYLDEPFYPALAARIDTRDLSGRQRRAVEKYRDEKRALRRELEEDVERAQGLAPDARSTAFAELARRQESELAALEQRAEELRVELYRDDYRWKVQRVWQLDPNASQPNTPQEIGRVMRAMAFEQNGLSLEQRGLLREIAIEVRAGAETAEAAAQVQPYAFFSPSPARVRFAEGIPAEVAAQVASYESRKSALKKKLYDVVFAEDGTRFDLQRSSHLRKLAAEQAPEFAALEILAEKIRRDLARLPPSPAPPRGEVLSPKLAAQVRGLLDRQAAKRKDLELRVSEVRARHPELRIAATVERDALVWDVSPRAPAPVKTESTRQELEAIAHGYEQAVAAMTVERNAVRRELAEELHTTNPGRINAVLAEGARQALEEASAKAQRDYRVAVFEPGLSPAQRRLLVGGALAELELPLPNAEFLAIDRTVSTFGRR